MKESNMSGFIHLSDLDDAQHRFRSICEIRDKRLMELIGSSKRMQAVCEQIPQNFSEVDGYHRDCYQRLTMNMSRLKTVPQPGTSNEQAERLPRRSSSEGKDNILFEPNCIFCKKYERIKVKRQNAWTTKGLTNFDHGGGHNIIKLAEERGDEQLLTRIRGEDLFAREAKYHISCRMKYTVPTKWQSDNVTAKQHQKELEEIHNMCFSQLCQVIDSKIIHGKEVMKMTDLRDLLIHYLSETPFANPNYRSHKLKSRLISHEVYGNKISFVSLGKKSGQVQSDLVFSNEIDLSEAVKNGYLLGCSDMIHDVGILLRNIIKDAFQKAEQLPWPPTASYLQT
jgi:hypothetical protein